MADMDTAVQDYVENISPEHRPQFDCVDSIIGATFPEATVGLAYGMPKYSVGVRSLNLGVWSHGLSIYGSESGNSAEFRSNHPTLEVSRGTVRIRPQDAVDITDGELRDLVRAALAD